LIQTIGIARATTKIGLANLVYNIKRLICLERREAVVRSQGRTGTITWAPKQSLNLYIEPPQSASLTPQRRTIGLLEPSNFLAAVNITATIAYWI